MKRISTILATAALALGLAIGLCSCAGGANESPADAETLTMQQLLDDGYVCSMSTLQYDTNTLNALYTNVDNTSFATVTKVLTDEELAQYEATSEADDWAAAFDQFLIALPDLEIRNIDYMIPSQEELDAWVGKTVGDLYAENFMLSGWFADDETCILCFSNESLDLDVTVDTAGETFPSPEVDPDADPMSIANYAITSVTFRGFGWGDGIFNIG